MTAVLLDTDVAALTMRGQLGGNLPTLLAGATWCISFVTLGEVAKWTVLHNWDPDQLASLEEWLRNTTTLICDDEVSLIWGEIQARARLRGRPRSVNDSWIAACALAYNLPLATLNLKEFEDFASFEGLKLLEVSTPAAP